MSTDTEIDLESLISTDAIKCESRHAYVRECSVEVVYHVTDCLTQYRVCRNTVEDPEQGTWVAMHRPGQHCIYCDRPAKVCWKVRPI